jgi:hypothetical protein
MKLCFFILLAICIKSPIFGAIDSLLDLSANVYNIQNISTLYRLRPLAQSATPTHIGFNSDQVPVEHDMALGALRDGFKFVKVGDHYSIQSVLGKKSFLYCYDHDQVSYADYKESDPAPFLWSITKNSNNTFSLKAKISNNSLGMAKKEHSYILALSAIEEDSRAFEWRFHPLYPSSGYSNFYDIIEDFGRLIAAKYGVTLEETQIQSTFARGLADFSIKINRPPLPIVLYPGVDSIANIYTREIFRTEEHFKSDDLSARSLYKFSRIIEVEESFQASIENSLGITSASSAGTERKKAAQISNTQSKTHEIMDQRGLNEKLFTRANISLAASENIHTDSSRSGTHSQRKGRSSEKSKSSQTSLGGEASYQLTMKAGVENPLVSASTSHSIAVTGRAGRNDTVTDINTTQEDSTLTSQLNRSTGASNEKQKQREKHKGTEHDWQEMRANRTTRDFQEMTAANDEYTSMRSFNISRTLNLGEVKTTVKKRMQQWAVEREIYQAPNTTLTIRVFEKALEAEKVKIESDVNVSGLIGFKFSQVITNLNCNPYTDHFDGIYWYLSPSTIIHYLPAPGYTPNQDGSIDYKVIGNLTIRHPLDIITMIEESTNQQHEVGEEL